MEVIVQKRFLRELEQLPKTVIVAVDNTIDRLRNSKTLSESNLDYRKIQGTHKGENFYRIRLGNYRIGIELIQPTVIIITIFHRQDDYKAFP